MSEKYWANIIRYYTNQVRLRELNEKLRVLSPRRLPSLREDATRHVCVAATSSRKYKYKIILIKHSLKSETRVNYQKIKHPKIKTLITN
ncbi:hypothetical protein PCC6912_00830 [Chlorogloeopsis fritschii PCC 6912]|uniref:Uncharacterized protein n=1 Tax=Chlorogloeopsis fritschii PCC 6912 TaxID=211165 RepID=A0A3S0Y231_CHLFR|nr:hypothetical protein PCC6912_00830 [Chlorogloeopsis fritschii PCC 6912]